ncbi:MAG: ImmA/IrrE family metallo-endopeptidase [Alphaproteobacteria bacterium]
MRELGVNEPQDIDLEAIAWHLGVRIKICELDGCEARIIGYQDRAIIRVDNRSSRRRRRFSIAHELGHWLHHRGRMLICRPDDIGSQKPGRPDIERVADDYAANLLLPTYLFLPMLQKHKQLNFGLIRDMADQFDVSATATAIRSVEAGHSSAFLICHGPKGRKWFRRSKDIPERWFPRDDLDHDSFAFDLLFGQSQEEARPRVIGGDAWFERNEAERYEVLEHSIRISSSEILSLILISDEKMLEEWDTSYRR